MVPYKIHNPSLVFVYSYIYGLLQQSSNSQTNDYHNGMHLMIFTVIVDLSLSVTIPKPLEVMSGSSTHSRMSLLDIMEYHQRFQLDLLVNVSVVIGNWCSCHNCYHKYIWPRAPSVHLIPAIWEVLE